MKLPAGVTTRIVLIRHGEPVAAARGKCYGKLDVGLSEDGCRQIKATARLLKRIEFAAVYSSPRIRAFESAKIIAAERDLPVETITDFAEIDFGDFEGLEYAEVERRFPAVYQQWMTAPTNVEFPNGESFEAMQKRVLRGVERVKQTHSSEAFAIVSHGGANRIVLADVLRIENANIFRLEQSFAAANVIDFYDDFPVLRAINLTAENFLWL